MQEAELARVQRIPTENLTAYDAWLRGGESFFRYSKGSNAQARQLFERAIELDSRYARAYAGVGWTYWAEWAFQWGHAPHLPERWFSLAQQALALDDSLPGAHGLLGYAYLWKDRQHEQAACHDRTIAV